VVFDRPIGMNQGIQHPLAEKWMYLESAWLMVREGGPSLRQRPALRRRGECSQVHCCTRAAHDAAWQAVATHGGFGYAKEYHVERLYRESALTRLAPITEQLIMSFIAEKVLGLPKSY
jgi:acyl-CoA dehydrogenase